MLFLAFVLDIFIFPELLISAFLVILKGDVSFVSAD